MHRKTALATAAAVTMTLLSCVVAAGTHTGALGLGGSPPAAVAEPAAAPRATSVRAPEHQRDDEREHEREHDDDHEDEGRESDD
jgi:hypothetical protein